MVRRRPPTAPPDASDVDGALGAMNAGELRAFVRGLLLELDDAVLARVVDSLVERAARGDTEWAPDGPSGEDVSKILAFVEAAKRVGYAHPSDVDAYLRYGTNAFLARDYSTAAAIGRALLLPVCECDIDLGQHEMVEEVLRVDVAACAAQYVVATYMTVAPEQRGRAVLTAIREVSGVGCFWEPLRDLERVAIEPLPEFDDFLRQWRASLEETRSEHPGGWDSDEHRWLREVVQRMGGTDGLAKHARSSKRVEDLSAWCRALVDARDWEGALIAHEEAADIVAENSFFCGDFLDGAALAAQELGRRDLAGRLERAWRQEPSMPRLRRWLGSAKSKTTLAKRTKQALGACPKKSYRQEAFLHTVLGDARSAAELLAAAPGLGWSDGEHPGHLLFPLFHALLGGVVAVDTSVRIFALGMDIEVLELMALEHGQPCLATPAVDEIFGMAGIDGTVTAAVRAAIHGAMRQAAEKRLAAVTEHKRRRHYGHAASLAAACVAVDSTPETAAWMAAVRHEFRRFPALQQELARHGAVVK